MTLPNTETGISQPWGSEPTPRQLALARGHRWVAMLESGDLKSLHEISPKEGLDSSYVSRMVNLTTLAPDIVAAILDETLPPDVTVFYLAVDPPLLWEGQRRRIRMPISHRPHNLDVLNQGGRFHGGRAREALGCLISLIPWPHGGHYTSRAGD